MFTDRKNKDSEPFCIERTIVKHFSKQNKSKVQYKCGDIINIKNNASYSKYDYTMDSAEGWTYVAATTAVGTVFAVGV